MNDAPTGRMHEACGGPDNRRKVHALAAPFTAARRHLSMSPQTALPTFRIDPGTALAQAQLPSTRPVSLQSPAIEVITDLAQVKAATVAPGTSLPQAEQTMILQGVRMLFVVSDLPAFEGLITHTDLHGARQMSVVNERRVRWDALCVADVMTEVAVLDAVDFDSLRNASVANLIATLKRFGRNHLLVLQRAGPSAPSCVRGVISRAQIERQLGQPIVLSEIASSFAEIGRALS